MLLIGAHPLYAVNWIRDLTRPASDIRAPDRAVTGAGPQSLQGSRCAMPCAPRFRRHSESTLSNIDLKNQKIASDRGGEPIDLLQQSRKAISGSYEPDVMSSSRCEMGETIARSATS
jgi:hypothetical protein